MALSESFSLKKYREGITRLNGQVFMPAQLWYFVCVIANWLQNVHATESDKLIHPWIVEEAQVVVKIESESEK